MANIKQGILDDLQKLYKTQHVLSVTGTYEYPKGNLIFHWSDDSIEQEFTYKGDGINSYSVSGFKTLLADTGGTIVKKYNERYHPDALAEFMEEVTE